MHDYDSPAMAMSSVGNVTQAPRGLEPPLIPQLFEMATVIEKRLADLRQRLEPVSRPSPPRGVSQKDPELSTALPELLRKLRGIESQIAELTTSVVL